MTQTANLDLQPNILSDSSVKRKYMNFLFQCIFHVLVYQILRDLLTQALFFFHIRIIILILEMKRFSLLLIACFFDKLYNALVSKELSALKSRYKMVFIIYFTQSVWFYIKINSTLDSILCSSFSYPWSSFWSQTINPYLFQ